MSSVILAAPPAPGEIAPLLEISRGLVERGHDVVMIAISAFRTEIEATGARFEPLEGAADLSKDEVASVIAEAALLPPGPDQLNMQWTRLFADPIPQQHAALQRLLAEDPSRVLLANSLFLGQWPVALGAPGLSPALWIAIGANPLMLSSADTTPFGPIPVPEGQDPKSGNLAANAGFAQATEPTRLHIESIVRSLGGSGTVPPFVDGIASVADLFASLSVPDLDFPRTDLLESVKFVGILPPRAARDWSRPNWWADLSGDRQVVVVTQGTVANGSLGDLVEPTLAGLAHRDDLLVVAATGREAGALQVEVPSNARVETFIPFTELLAHANLLITNGGYGGTQQALASGVPVIVAGATEDKPATAARVAFHRLGADLGTSTPDATQIADSVAAVLSDASIQENVERISQTYSTYNALDQLEQMMLDRA